MPRSHLYLLCSVRDLVIGCVATLGNVFGDSLGPHENSHHLLEINPKVKTELSSCLSSSVLPPHQEMLLSLGLN